jgi:hypothetical protein
VSVGVAPPPRTDLNNHVYLPTIVQSRTGGS